MPHRTLRAIKKTVSLRPECALSVRLVQSHQLLNSDRGNFSEALNTLIIAQFYNILTLQKPRNQIHQKIQDFMTGKTKITQQELDQYKRFLNQIPKQRT